MSAYRTFLPAGTKRGVTEAVVLRRFAANIEHAAKNCGAAGAPYRRAYLDALRRADNAERQPMGGQP